MGIAPFELPLQHVPIPNFIKNQSMANIVYLIKHNPSQGKKSHMSVIVDLAGESNAIRISGLMLHAMVDRPVRNVPALTKFDHLTYNVEKCQVEYRVIGQLESSVYLANIHMIPNALKNLLISDTQMIPDVFKDLLIAQFYKNLCSTNRSPSERANMFLIPLGEAVYHELIQSNSGCKSWSTQVNCQQYVRLLTKFGLGLQWPDDVDVTDDVAPEIVEIGFFYQSLATKRYDNLKFTVSFLSNSPLIFHHNSTDYNKYLLSQTNAFPPGESILSSTVCHRLSSSTPTQIFQTQNRAGLYQLCSN